MSIEKISCEKYLFEYYHPAIDGTMSEKERIQVSRNKTIRLIKWRERILRNLHVNACVKRKIVRDGKQELS